jgi:hypothetical protein
MANKEDYYLEQLDKARKELEEFYQKELLKCPCCSRRSQRQKWALETYVQEEAESGYPISYRTYYSYKIVCPRCNTAIDLKQKPVNSMFFINKPA